MVNSDNLKKLPSLDGWRAVSIALVLLDHSGYTRGFPTALNPLVHGWFGTGPMGVLFFFVISGFLITWLLLQEQAKHGFISLKHFYLRRALRILPVYFLYLVVLGFFTRYSQPASAWLANLTFTTNFFAHPGATEHFWSLGVEEQFYLLWPGLLILFLHRQKNGDGTILLKFLAVPLVVAPIARMIECKHWYPEPLHCLFAPGSFFLHFDALAYGCMAAVLFTRWRTDLELFFEKHPRAIAWGGVGLILAPAALSLVHFPGRFQAAGSGSLLSIGFGLLLLQSILYPGRGFYRLLNWKWVSHVGVLSYSIYIWQQMFFGTGESIFGVKDAWWTDFPVWLLTALLAAHASYYLLEKPLLGLRAKFRAI
jgi:peptidoglycan/LPS O-acetylase OafA/YrhL